MLYVMLVGAYPFERPEDKSDTQKLQKMIQVRCMAQGAHAEAAAREAGAWGQQQTGSKSAAVHVPCNSPPAPAAAEAVALRWNPR